METPMIIDTKAITDGKPQKTPKTGVSALRPAARQRISTRTEVVQSYSHTLSHQFYGGHQYESSSFFCSQKAECDIKDAEEVGDVLYGLCRRQVLKQINNLIAELEDNDTRMLPPPGPRR